MNERSEWKSEGKPEGSEMKEMDSQLQERLRTLAGGRP